jgi:hypothetical protein
MVKTPLKQLYTTLITQSLRDARDEEELLLWMLLVHTYEIHLREAVIEDFPERLLMPLATQRYAAEILSSVWPEQDEKRSANYWYRRFQFRVGDPKKAVVTRRTRLEELAARLQEREQVAKVLPGVS